MKKFAIVLSLAIALGCWGHAQKKPKTSHESASEAATEKRSGINDKVDLVEGPRVENVTAHSATLVWKTNNVAATNVRYGTDPNNLKGHVYERGGSRDHRVELKNLHPGKTYHYEVLTRHGKDRLNGEFQTK